MDRGRVTAGTRHCRKDMNRGRVTTLELGARHYRLDRDRVTTLGLAVRDMSHGT
ncbi:hypothetical protein [Nannocystis pusilla]|uniref:hypothetical protein n=1 Tax=Nannocystis pusilla TaxID=889268 RepID=UPI003B828B18